MRRKSATLVLSTVFSSALVALPTVTAPANAAPVAPRVQALPLIGVDAAELAASPEPEKEQEARATAVDRATSVAPAWRERDAGGLECSRGRTPGRRRGGDGRPEEPRSRREAQPADEPGAAGRSEARETAERRIAGGGPCGRLPPAAEPA